MTNRLRVAPALFLGAGALAALLFHAGVYFPISISVLAFVAAGWYLFVQYRDRRVGVLVILLWLVFTLPFIHIPPYLFFDFGSENPSQLWGLATVPYMLDHEIIKLTAMLGAVGGLGMAFGSSLSRSKLVRDDGIASDGRRAIFRTLSLPIWVVWLAAGFFLSWLSAPTESVFTSRYTVSQSLSGELNFSSAWMISYVILTFLLCDSLLEPAGALRRTKLALLVLVSLFIVLFFQLLRGDRESVPWVFAVAMVYFYWAAGYTQRRGYEIPWAKVAGWATALFVVSMFVGEMRHLLVGIDDVAGVMNVLEGLVASNRIGVSNLLHGTWSAALLTPLSVAGDHVYGLLHFKLGEDYLDLLLSTPPGFVADMIGYQRPIDAQHGPALEMRYGLGGTHAVVLPFRNFGMIGVFLIPALWTYVVARFEKRASRKVSVLNLALLATIATASSHWLWYGEKNGFNAIVLWLVIGICYRVCKGLRLRR